MSFGVGPGISQEASITPDLLSEKIAVSPVTFRRLTMRLSVSDLAPFFKDGQASPIIVKSMNGGIVEVSESFQIIVDQEKRSLGRAHVL